MSDASVEHTPRNSNPAALAEAQDKADEALVGGPDPRAVEIINSWKCA